MINIINSYEKSIKKYEAQYNFYNELKLKNTIHYRNILLTGATGYFGIHILYDLINHTGSHITLFVRGNSVKYQQAIPGWNHEFSPDP